MRAAPEARSALDHLACARCDRTHDPARLRGLCGCGGILLARYRLGEAARSLTPNRLERRRPDLWRYAEVLPGSHDPVSLGEGMTPLLEARALGEALGLPRLLVKDEAQNPTGSFKARGMSTAVTMARALGATGLALPSAGNAGGAAAAYGARARIPVDVFLPVHTPDPFRLEAAAHGARVHLVAGTISDCGARMREEGEGRGWFDLSTLREPFRLEGKKTLGYELAEQLGWVLPDVIVYPTGGGTGLLGMWKAFEELEAMGLSRGRRPRMVTVQARGCAPIVRAFEAGEDRVRHWPDPHTYASGLLVPAPYADTHILAVLRSSGGTAIAVGEQAMADGQGAMARLEGIFACPEGGATVAAARALRASGFLDGQDRVVLVNTGSGLKYPAVPGLDVPGRAPHDRDTAALG